jgi:hypothetical protein
LGGVFFFFFFFCGFLTYNRDDKGVIVQMAAPSVTD